MTAARTPEEQAAPASTAIVGTVEPITSLDRADGTKVMIGRTQMELLKNTVARDADDNQLMLFLEYCKRSGLDPFTRQIYCKVDRQGRMSIITGIDGMRVAAARTGAYLGTTQPEWCGLDGVWHDVWLGEGKPAAARVGVKRQAANGTVEITYRVATFNEFGKSGSSYPNWEQMPAHMLAIRAESHALRAACPNELGGIYTADEVEHGDNGSDTMPNQQQLPAGNQNQQQAPANGNGRGTGSRGGQRRAEPTPPQAREEPASGPRASSDDEMKALATWIHDEGITNRAIWQVLNVPGNTPLTLDSMRDWMQSNNVSISTFKDTLRNAMAGITAAAAEPSAEPFGAADEPSAGPGPDDMTALL